MKADVRRVLENAAQHLWHADHSLGEIGMILGVSANAAHALVEGAEIRQPKHCADRTCTYERMAGAFLALCPYCDSITAVLYPR